jgi:glycosyltransferase involved in cell wall biosynthesis
MHTPAMPRRLLVVTEDPVGDVLGGAAIRAYEIARGLADVAEVTLAAPGVEPPELAPVRHVAFEVDDQRPLRELFERADVVITRPPNPLVGGWLRRSKARIVFDLYDPLPLDFLEAQASAPPVQQLLWNTIALDHFLNALHSGHHFICGGRRQRDLYLGALLASRLISPAAYSTDPSFRSFIDRVPFGIPAEQPRRIEGAGPRHRFPELGEDAEIVLWNGGIWNWLDPVTAVAATVQAAERNPQVRLVFMRAGLGESPENRVARDAHELAKRLGVLDRLVFFNDLVVSYAERATWLMEAACIISTNLDHLESNFSFRTRLLDCFWVGVPAVCTAGDELSEAIERCDGGITVPYGDVDAVAAGIVEVVSRSRDDYRKRLLAAGEELVWPRAIEPLRRIVALEGTPHALGEPLARRFASPMRRGRSAATRLVRSVPRKS